jgi:hypothetical protein
LAYFLKNNFSLLFLFLFGLLEDSRIEGNNLRSGLSAADTLRHVDNRIGNKVCHKRDSVKNDNEGQLDDLDGVTTNRNVLRDTLVRRE